MPAGIPCLSLLAKSPQLLSVTRVNLTQNSIRNLSIRKSSVFGLILGFVSQTPGSSAQHLYFRLTLQRNPLGRGA